MTLATTPCQRKTLNSRRGKAGHEEIVCFAAGLRAPRDGVRGRTRKEHGLDAGNRRDAVAVNRSGQCHAVTHRVANPFANALAEPRGIVAAFAVAFAGSFTYRRARVLADAAVNRRRAKARDCRIHRNQREHGLHAVQGDRRVDSADSERPKARQH